MAQDLYLVIHVWLVQAIFLAAQTASSILVFSRTDRLSSVFVHPLHSFFFVDAHSMVTTKPDDETIVGV